MNDEWYRPDREQQRPAAKPGESRPQTKPAKPAGERAANGEKPPAKGGKAKRNRPTWERVAIGIVKYASIPVIICAAIIVGLYIGYVKLGDQPSADIFRIETWKHIFDLIFANS